jgi:hypothetical protein
MWERPDEEAMGYRDQEGSTAGGSGLTNATSLGSSCMSDDLHESGLCFQPSKVGLDRSIPWTG